MVDGCRRWQVVIASAAWLLGCAPRRSTPAEEPATASTPAAVTAPASVTNDATPMTYYSDDELRALGLSVERISPAMAIVCPEGGDNSRCTCIEPLDCGDDCMTFDRNLELFKEALAATSGATVQCDEAQTGTCDAYRYFNFEGDIHRYELRLFGTDGRLAAMRNWTDYAEFCDQRTLSRWAGGIPRCETMTLGEWICGDVAGPPPSPTARVTALAADPGAAR